ncbi:MAG TPA: MlaD family protein [Pirellulales bacterium]|jgi:phospholipid/cholesterol/gamma-HCH transport system substrate-binding protein|nr:MlaD family protein [Pirellulales bacterium]
MNERVIQFRVGVTVVAAILIALILVLLFDGFPQFVRAKPYTIYISFDQAPGVSEGTPVRKSGILIGRVKAVDFAEDIGIKPREGLRVVVTAEIQANRQVRHNELPEIHKSLLGGDAVIEFVLQESTKLPNTPVEPAERVPGFVLSDPMQTIGNLETSLTLALNSVSSTADEIGRLTRRVDDLLANNDEQMARVVGKAENALDSIQEAATNANDLLGDKNFKENVRQVASDLPKTVADLNESLSHFRSTVQLANKNLENIEGFTKPLGERGAQLVDHIDHAAQNLESVLLDTRSFTRAINSPSGSLGRLINDQQLYENLNVAVTNLNCMTRELTPILRDARVFTDKVSRHPESLGVRGALFPSAGIK